MAAKFQKEIQELQSQVIDESQMKVRLQMEVDSKDSEIEQLQSRLALLSSETASLSSGGAENENDDGYAQGKIIFQLIRVDIFFFKMNAKFFMYEFFFQNRDWRVGCRCRTSKT